MTTYSQTCNHPVATDNSRVLDNLVHLCREYFQKLSLKSKINAERRQLLEMSDAMLNDIGIDRVQAAQEAIRRDIPEARL
jgi:uncharacterized protein YjiS (DUF1127 family)